MNRTWHWEVQVEGEPRDVAHIHEHLLSTDMRMRHEPDNNTWWLSWDRMDGLDDAREAVEVVRLELSVLSGVLKVALGATRPLRPGGVMKVHNDGRRDFVLIVTRGIRLHARLNDDHGASLRALATADIAVSKALRLFAADDFESWVGFFRLYELLLSEVGGTSALVARGWGTEREHRRFKHSANSVTVGGDTSRHGTEPTQPPSDPMSLAEAQSYVERIFHSWLAAKPGSAA